MADRRIRVGVSCASRLVRAASRIAEGSRAGEKIRSLAFYDELTGLRDGQLFRKELRLNPYFSPGR